MSGPVRQRTVAVMAYGSLIHQPGPRLGPLIAELRRRPTPFPVEYGRRSDRWGGGPVLVPHAEGGQVEGALLVLRPDVPLGVAVEVLRGREGIPSPAGIVQVEMDVPYLVIAADLPRNLPPEEMTPPALADRAVASVGRGPRNGVGYLRGALRSGIRTPRSRDYAREVLDRTGQATLEAAERRLLGLRAAATGRRRGNGLG